MRKIRKILRLDLEKLVKMTIFGAKWPSLDRFWAKKGKLRFFERKIYWPYFQDPKLSFYEKNQKDPMTGYGKIGQNDNF